MPDMKRRRGPVDTVHPRQLAFLVGFSLELSGFISPTKDLWALEKCNIHTYSEQKKGLTTACYELRALLHETFLLLWPIHSFLLPLPITTAYSIAYTIGPLPFQTAPWFTSSAHTTPNHTRYYQSYHTVLNYRTPNHITACDPSTPKHADHIIPYQNLLDHTIPYHNKNKCQTIPYHTVANHPVAVYQPDSSPGLFFDQHSIA